MEALLITIGTMVLLGLAAFGAVQAYQVVSGCWWRLGSPPEPAASSGGTQTGRTSAQLRAVRDNAVTELFQAGYEAYVARKDSDESTLDGSPGGDPDAA